MKRTRAVCFKIFCLLLAFSATATAQVERGEIRIRLINAAGVVVAGSGEITGAGLSIPFQISRGGTFDAPHLPFGTYTVRALTPGYTPQERILQVSSTLPTDIVFTFNRLSVNQSVTVNASATAPLASAATVLRKDELHPVGAMQPGRDLLNAVIEQPGWLFEANGVPHPRGSEYETQFVINGMPRTENLSPAFAMPIPAADLESVQVRTAGYPAEYGRSLGGVVDVTTASSWLRGWHGSFGLNGGSFHTVSGDGSLSFGKEKTQTALFVNSFTTDRLFDPPVTENYTNHGTGRSVRADQRWRISARDDLQLDVSGATLHADVPNERVQQQQGQEQNRSSTQYSGTAAWTHTFSPTLLFSLLGGALDSTATLASNTLATPIIVDQDRGFRQMYTRADLAGHHGAHDWKFGFDLLSRHVREQLNYTITDPDDFDPGTQPQFNFANRRWDIEPAAYMQDTFHTGLWSIAAGLRWDGYAFVVRENAWSPRIAVARAFPRVRTAVHISYDRIFQTPPVENLLLASSDTFGSGSDFVERLPVHPGRAHFVEAGFTSEFAGPLHISGKVFLRRWKNFSDDDTLLNTGVSFPFTTRRASIHGQELALWMPERRGIQFQISYSNQNGTSRGPITGGLLLGDEGADALAGDGTFPISQDQRNTLRARLRLSPKKFFWIALASQYNSGLPVELDDDTDEDDLRAAYGDHIVNAVNLQRGRIRPWSSLDAAAGIRICTRDNLHCELEMHAANLTDRLNVINFASLFSGTAVGVPRSYSAQFRVTF